MTTEPGTLPQPPTEDPDDQLHYDDAVVHRVFKWSKITVLVLVVGAGVTYVLLRRAPAPTAPRLTPISAPTLPTVSSVNIPRAEFADITSSCGVRFVHNNGAYGEKLLPETMGGGTAFFDFDNDGNQDLLLVNSSYWPWHVPQGAESPTHALYRNDGNGHFADVTSGSGLDVAFYGMGVAVGDFDNDGYGDVLLTGVGGSRLFKNQGAGKFQDITQSAGVGGSAEEWSTSAAWLDYDNDGRLDLFVCNYVQWSREIDIQVGYKLVGVGRAYGQPMNFQGTFSRLYHNEGNGRFSDVSSAAGIQVRNPATGVPAGKSLGITPADLDNDGWMDIVVANDAVQNFVFHNQHNGTFKEIGASTGIAFDNFGRTRGAMGIDSARYRDDESLGIVIGNFATEMTALYVSQPTPLVFADETIPEGLGPPGLLLLKFGVFFFDYDLDGRLDVLTANGHLEEEIGKIQHDQQYRQPAQLFWNHGGTAGPGCFLAVPPERANPDLFKPIVGRGSAYADLDADGDLDVILTQTGGAPLLLRNDQPSNHDWIRLKLVGTDCNRDAIGAWIRVDLGGKVLWRQVMPTRGYLSQSELPVTIGLGSGAEIKEVEVLWPGGTRQKVQNPPLRKLMIVTQGKT